MRTCRTWVTKVEDLDVAVRSGWYLHRRSVVDEVVGNEIPDLLELARVHGVEDGVGEGRCRVGPGALAAEVEKDPVVMDGGSRQSSTGRGPTPLRSASRRGR